MSSQGESHNSAGRNLPSGLWWQEGKRARGSCGKVKYNTIQELLPPLTPLRQKETTTGDHQPRAECWAEHRFAIKIRPVRQHAVLKCPRQTFSYFPDAKSRNVMEKDRLPPWEPWDFPLQIVQKTVWKWPLHGSLALLLLVFSGLCIGICFCK